MLNLIVCSLEEVDKFVDEVEGVISIMNPGERCFEPLSIAIKEKENSHSILRLDFDDTWQEIYQSGEEMIEGEMIEQAIAFSENIWQYGHNNSDI